MFSSIVDEGLLLHMRPTTAERKIMPLFRYTWVVVVVVIVLTLPHRHSLLIVRDHSTVSNCFGVQMYSRNNEENPVDTHTRIIAEASRTSGSIHSCMSEEEGFAAYTARRNTAHVVHVAGGGGGAPAPRLAQTKRLVFFFWGLVDGTPKAGYMNLVLYRRA